MRRFLVVQLALVAALAACGDSEKREALLFVERAQGIEVDAPEAERRALVDRLEQMPLETEEVRRIRDACVTGHRALLEAEAAQAEASEALDRLTGGDAHAPIRREAAEQIDATIHRSNLKVAEAREHLETCNQGVTSLRSRFASER